MRHSTPGQNAAARGSLRGMRSLAVGLVAVLALGVVACGDDDGEDATVPLSEWLDSFDQLCLDAIEEVESSEMTDEEFEESFRQFQADVLALPEPDEKSDTVAELNEAMESLLDASWDEADAEALDEEVNAALVSLGVSDACIAGTG